MANSGFRKPLKHKSRAGQELPLVGYLSQLCSNNFHAFIMPIKSRLLPQISISSTQLFLQLHSISTLCATMASQLRPRVDLDDKTVEDLIDDCLSMFPYCTQVGNMVMRLLVGNMMESFRFWADNTEETAAASGSVEKALESRPNTLEKIKFALFIIFDKLNWYKSNASEDEETARCLVIIKHLIDGLDIVGRSIV